MLRMHQRVLVFASGLVLLSGCATAPPAAAPTIAFEQKMAWILQLEDRRVLSVPAPPPAVVPGARRGAAPVPAPAPDLARLTTDREPLVRGRAAEALGAIDAKDAAGAIGKMAAEYARSAAVLAMQPDDEPSPSPPEAEAFKLGIFALVRIRAYDALAGAVLDGSGRPIS